MELILRGARLEEREDIVDIGLRDGRIAAVERGLKAAAEKELDLDGRLVSPSFVEPHIHLDKVGVVRSLPTEPLGHAGGSDPAPASEQAHRDRGGDRRPCRTDHPPGRDCRHNDHSQSCRRGHDRRAAAARGRIAGSSGALRSVRHPDRRLSSGGDRARPRLRGADAGGDAGRCRRRRWDAALGIRSRQRPPHIEFCLDLAVEHDAPVDMHVDETDDPNSRTLELLIEAAEARDWGPRTNAGHCCAMAAWEDGYSAQVIQRLADTGMSVITNPCTNLLLQGREDAEPRRRGIPRIKELLAAGVRLGCGQDCVEDAFYPFGAADQLQVALILVHAAQLSTPPEVKAALDMPRFGAARHPRDRELRDGPRRACRSGRPGCGHAGRGPAPPIAAAMGDTRRPHSCRDRHARRAPATGHRELGASKRREHGDLPLGDRIGAQRSCLAAILCTQDRVQQHRERQRLQECPVREEWPYQLC